MRRRLILHETGFPRFFSLPTLLTVGYSSGYFLFTSYSTMIEYACINTRLNNSREITSMPADQNRDEHGASFQSLPKINRKTHLHKMKVYNTRPVYSLTIETFTEVFTCSKAFNAFKRYNSWTDPFRKSSTSFASIFPNHSSQNKV